MGRWLKSGYKMPITRYTCRRFPLIKESETGEYVAYHEHEQLMKENEEQYQHLIQHCRNLEVLKNDKIEELLAQKQAITHQSEWFKRRSEIHERNEILLKNKCRKLTFFLSFLVFIISIHNIYFLIQ